MFNRGLPPAKDSAGLASCTPRAPSRRRCSEIHGREFGRIRWSSPVRDACACAEVFTDGSYGRWSQAFLEGVVGFAQGANAANVARLLPPSIDRVARIWEKVAEPGRALSSATSTQTGTWWRWHWLNQVARSTVLEQSFPAMATCPWSLSTPTCGDGV